ncbi:MAG: transposase [Planctomycetaceae bacterium]|jgi:transposase|nr:transposase [Planctomycetaceae bacterium]
MIVLDVPRVQCHDCSCIKQIHLTFAKEHKHYTRFFESYAVHVLDRFHVVKLFNEQLTTFRRCLLRETLDKDSKNSLKRNSFRFDETFLQFGRDKK